MKLIYCLPLLLLNAQDPPVTFGVSTRLVEVYATVLDKSDHPIRGLARDAFEVLDGGKPQQLVAFGSSSDSLSLAVLLDTTGSMRDALPVVKNATNLMIDQLRDNDSVAIYGFSNGIELLQDFTQDKRAAKLTVRRLRAEGATALFDALTRVSQDLTTRQGKRAVVVFTDGEDNSSVLNMESAVLRARKSGVPVYAIAQGDALKAPRLVKALQSLSENTGGKLFKAQKSSQMDEIFQAISADLQASYLLSFRPPTVGKGEWRPIRVTVKTENNYKVHCREGYYAD